MKCHYTSVKQNQYKTTIPFEGTSALNSALKWRKAYWSEKDNITAKRKGSILIHAGSRKWAEENWECLLV